MTRIQKRTLVLLMAYGVWEIIVWQWAKKEPGPIIRADLVFIYPVLAIFVIISLVQYFKKSK